MVTDRYGVDEPQPDPGMFVGRPAQRGGPFQRHIDVATEDGLIDDGLVEGDREPTSGDNLVAGDVPEEDGGDHRVEPAIWLTAPSPQRPPLSPPPGHTTP